MPLSPLAGQVVWTAANYPPMGTARCDGGRFSSAVATELFEVIGTAFGGDDERFAVPDLMSATAVGSSEASPIGQATSLAAGSDVETLGLLPTIAVDGMWPMAAPEDSYIADILLLAFGPSDDRELRNTLPCDGRTVPVEQYQALFALLGTTYGGDGVRNFGLPDLRGAVPQQPRQDGTVAGAMSGDGGPVALSLYYAIVTMGIWPSRD